MQVLSKESDLEQRCREWAYRHGILSTKLRDRGWPDRLFVCPGGVAIFVEFKRKGQKPRSIQQYHINRLRAKGHIVAIVVSLKEFQYVVHLHG
jgi:hypothetical protein